MTLLGTGLASAAALYIDMPGGRFESALAGPEGKPESLQIRPFAMRAWPVQVGELEHFLCQHPSWQAGQIAAILRHPGPHSDAAAGCAAATQTARPATDVSWFVARAYCTSEQARLPTWFEWEYAAAASADSHDARQSHAYLQRILQRTLAPPATLTHLHHSIDGIYGLYDGYWEWLDDAAALFPQDDARAADGVSSLQLCGGAALAFFHKENYALILRAGALANADPRSGNPLTTFRCVRPRPGVR